MRNWEDRQVVVLGLARQGKALARFLAERGARVIVSDLKSSDELAGAMEEMKELDIEYVLGGHPMGLLMGTSQIYLSGGVPSDLAIIEHAVEEGIFISNDSQLFMELCPAPVIGITGSAGKSTTTALVGEIAKLAMSATGRVWVGGNIGHPLLLDLPSIHPNDWVVMELSSFQLEWMTTSPTIAAVLNISPNHLDRHRTMEAYLAAKAKIMDFQDEQEIAVLGKDSPDAWRLRDRVKGRLLTFGMNKEKVEEGTFPDREKIWLKKDGQEKQICSVESIPLRGRHNQENVLAACAIAAGAGFPLEVMEAAIREFKGLPHRLEFVRQIRGVNWYNDSIATSPERAVASIRSFSEPIVLLAGGKDKDLPWEEFAEVVSRRVNHLVLFGQAAEKIGAAIEDISDRESLDSIEMHTTFEEAVVAASRLARSGDIVLLAPGGTSFDQFRDFEERGERFRQLVNEL